jgi:hypothetical protein
VATDFVQAQRALSQALDVVRKEQDLRAVRKSDKVARLPGECVSHFVVDHIQGRTRRDAFEGVMTCHSLSSREPQAAMLRSVLNSTGWGQGGRCAAWYGQKQDELASAAAGFDHHLVKPADTRRLLRLIKGIDAGR